MIDYSEHFNPESPELMLMVIGFCRVTMEMSVLWNAQETERYLEKINIRHEIEANIEKNWHKRDFITDLYWRQVEAALKKWHFSATEKLELEFIDIFRERWAVTALEGVGKGGKNG